MCIGLHTERLYIYIYICIVMYAYVLGLAHALNCDKLLNENIH